MFTAYCIHTSEGIPVRRIVETELMADLLKVTTTDCDWDWNKKGKPTTFTIPAPDTRLFESGNRELKYHQKFRVQMNHQHNWRFEIYWPLSSLN